ncbi:MAG: 1-acyl-sn-glycerol-3-phosphate acyltransferase [Alphaproteobacteria bacterium]|nr:1-acyl-sn-glycerol-3-phosphate acyltransferase [Alphaproteobacteria bacterium]
MSQAEPLIDRVLRTLIHGLVTFVYRPRYIDFDKIPESGPAILISNHVSYMDGPLINAGCRRVVHYVIDEDIYNVPGVNFIMKRAQAIPIAPNRKSVEHAFNLISEALRRGEVVCIFPEGFLTFTGGLGRFRPGIEWIIKRDPVPIIPIVLSGLWGSVFSRQYRGSWRRFFPRRWLRGHVAIKCGDVVDPSRGQVNELQDIVMKLKYSF